MHIYVLARGLQSALKEWENYMSSQYLPFEVKEKGKKKPSPYLAQLQVREIKMYEIVCPEESANKVLGMIKPGNLYGEGKKFNGIVKWISKKLGLHPIPKTWTPSLLPQGGGCSFVGLGITKDVMNWKKKSNGNDVLDVGTPKEML